MEPIYLIIAGVMGIAVAAGHGYIGQTTLIRNLRADDPIVTQFNAMVFHMSTAYWFLMGVGLIWASTFDDLSARSMVALIACVVYGPPALGNFIGSKGRHPGWVMLGTSTVFAAMSI